MILDRALMDRLRLRRSGAVGALGGHESVSSHSSLTSSYSRRALTGRRQSSTQRRGPRSRAPEAGHPAPLVAAGRWGASGPTSGRGPEVWPKAIGFRRPQLGTPSSVCCSKTSCILKAKSVRDRDGLSSFHVVPRTSTLEDAGGYRGDFGVFLLKPLAAGSVRLTSTGRSQSSIKGFCPVRQARTSNCWSKGSG